tara:strand:- start:1108 stop:1548 length:441 start_codon:yes stop_codon:yes gene_type:complete
MDKKTTQLMFSSKSNMWSTPQKLFDKLDDEFNFTIDVCCTDDNAKCINYYTEKDDGLKCEWKGNVWCNPPYSDIKSWVIKADQEIQKSYCNKIVMLVPSRTDTAWWHDYVVYQSVRFIRGRLKFGEHKNSAPFPSAIIIFNKQGEQ